MLHSSTDEHSIAGCKQLKKSCLKLLENNSWSLLFPPEHVWNSIQVISWKMQHESAAPEVTWGWGGWLEAQLDGSDRLDTYLHACTCLRYPSFLSFLSIPPPHLCRPIYRAHCHRNYSWLLFCIKYTWLLVKNPPFPVVQTQLQTHLQLKFLTSSLHTFAC